MPSVRSAESPQTYVFCGVGGSGMSALAVMMARKGHHVIGTDRSYDCGQSPDKFKRLIREGVVLLPQDGSALSAEIDYLVVSSAIENSIPDVKSAKEHNVPIMKRADLLAECVNDMRGITVAGTSGKTTVTAMIGHILTTAGKAPTVINGGMMLNFKDDLGAAQNIHLGDSDICIAEIDESDGSIALYDPAIALLNNIAEDHKTMDELKQLFGDYLARATEKCVVNKDDDIAAALALQAKVSAMFFSAHDENADLYGFDYRLAPHGSQFKVRHGKDVHNVNLNVPGKHNMMNALAAMAVCLCADVPVAQSAAALNDFKGTQRRLEVVGTAGGVTVIDDFGHNPDKIAASLVTMKESDGRLIAIFQPHGYGPMKLMGAEIVSVVTQYLDKNDIFIMPDIYDAGGTADRSISSGEIIAALCDNGVNAHHIGAREDIAAFITDNARDGDRILVMGARDDTLTDFCRDILGVLDT